MRFPKWLNTDWHWLATYTTLWGTIMLFVPEKNTWYVYAILVAACLIASDVIVRAWRKYA